MFAVMHSVEELTCVMDGFLNEKGNNIVGSNKAW